MRTKGLVVEGLSATADRTRVDVFSDEGDHLGPIELATDILDGLGDARVSSQVMIVMRAQDVQSDILIIRDIDQSLLAKEVAIL